MILVDTSVWIDHLRHGDAVLSGLLNRGQVLGHPFVIGELAAGGLRQRATVRKAMYGLPQAVVAHVPGVPDFIEREALFRSGFGYIDIHLLASVRLTADTKLLTRDRHRLIGAQGMSAAAGV